MAPTALMAAARRREPDPPTQLRGLAAAIERDGCPAAVLLRGEERYFQFWFRDPQSAEGSTFDLTNGLKVVFCD